MLFLLLSVGVTLHISLHLAEEIRGEYEVVKTLAVALINGLVIAGPVAVAFVDEYDMLSYSQHGVHIVRVYHRSDAVFVSDIAKEVVNQNGRTGVKSRIRLVAEKVFGIKCYGTRYGHTLLHTSRNL